MPRLALLALALLVGTAQADVVNLNTGGRIEGLVEEEGAFYKITTTAGVTHIAKEKVASLEKKDCVLTVYAREAAKVAADDADGHWGLAQLCREGNWTAKARDEAKKVIAIAPDHADARKFLGYVRYDDKWMTQRERFAAMGYVEYKGKWYPEEAARRRQARDERILMLKHAEDALNLALSHMAASDKATRHHGHNEYLEAAAKYGIQNAQPTADKLLDYYDDAWKQYVAVDEGIATTEIRATDAHLDSLDKINIDVTGGNGNGLVVAIEVPHMKITQIRTTVQVPVAMHVHLVDPLLNQAGGEDGDEGVLGNE